MAADVSTFDVAADGAFVVSDCAGASAYASAHASFVLVFSTNPMDKLLLAAITSFRTLGATGAAAFAAARASLVFVFSTTPVYKPPPAVSASLKT